MSFSIIFSLTLIVISFLSFLMYISQNSFKGYLVFSFIVYCLALIWIADDIGLMGVIMLTVVYAAVLIVLWTKYQAQMFQWWSSFSGFQTDMLDITIGDSASTITSLKMDGSLRYKGKKYYAKSSSVAIPANYSVTIESVDGFYLVVKPN